MLKIRVVLPGQAPTVHEFPDDQAVIGRSADCDVQVAERYVSKRHAKLLVGVALVDLDSSNGSHVEGRRIDEPTLLGPRSAFRLGSEPSDAVIEVEHVASGPIDAATARSLHEDLDEARRRNAALARDLAALQSAPAAPGNDPDEAATLRQELNDARRRIESLKHEIETRDGEASQSVQVRLANESLSDARRLNAELRKQVEQLQTQAATPAVEAARSALSERVAELEGERAQLRAELDSAQTELATARAPAEPGVGASELFFKLQADNQQLREQLRKAGDAPAGGSSELFFELQATNARLRARVDELEAAGPTAPEAAPSAAAAGTDDLDALQRENHDLRLSKADLAAELDRLRERVTAAAVAPVPAGADCGTVLFRALVDEDVERHPPRLEGGHEPFVVLELFRFMRQVERLVTRMTGDFIQLFDQRTILPDVAGNLRLRIGEILDNPAEARPRQDFIAYLDEMRRWLVVALGANRRAAERFAEEIRSDLSERSLTAARPMPALKRLTGGVDGELWTRASEYLKRLTADIVEERIQTLARECAEELHREQERE